jgi:exo-1,4-beta-D-glucosaminidase
MAADKVEADGSRISAPDFDATQWYAIRRMPATVLQVLSDNGVYKDLYFGMNLTTTVPKDLWKHEWWYRTAFTVPPGHDYYSLILNGINYRADIWLNGQLIANRSEIVGMYRRYELDVTKYVHPGGENVLAVKIIPEQKLKGPAMLGGAADGVELADSWLDWINWKYLGDPPKWLSYVPDRNAGVWKKVYLTYSGQVSVRDPYVSSDLPLPALSPATLRVYADVHNHGDEQVAGTLTGEITRQGKPPIRFAKTATLAAHETKEMAFAPSEFPALVVDQPDLWWPYTWGKPNLYDLRLDFEIDGHISDTQTVSFGIRKITQHRDSDESFPKLGKGGNFYLEVNGKDYLIRGAAYAPDLLFKNDPERDRIIMRYAKDLGINMLRWELKIADDDMLQLSDREGMPVMQGWMCCMQWESWNQWDEEDHRVAHASMQSQIRNLRSHPSAFIWANGSDGLPPAAVLSDYHQVLEDLHWQNATVDTVSHVNKSWSGIHMAGPYTWYPPYYWFSEKSGPARGSSAEEGNNETVPPLESLKKFIPADKLWPINEYWYFHCGGIPGNSQLENIKLGLDKRYGPSSNVAEFARKAQVAIYENVRAQFETYAASGWDTHKMVIYWMLDNHWPSFFGHLFDYYYKQGGGYFGAKKALRPLTVVFDSYATGDRSKANVYLVNQTTQAQDQLTVSATVYNLDGAAKHVESTSGLRVAPATSTRVLRLPRYSDLTSVYFVRLEVRSRTGDLLARNTYWQSSTDDVMAEPDENDMLAQMKLRQVSWGDYSALNQMPTADIAVNAHEFRAGDETKIQISLANNSDHIAFFIRAEVLNHAGGDEILPITYDDNYVTLFPHEPTMIEANLTTSQMAGLKPVVRIEGYNVPTKTGVEINH